MKNKITTTTTSAAQNAYNEKRQNIIALAAQLGELVQAHNTKTTDWAQVGDMGAIEAKLQEAIEFLSN